MAEKKVVITSSKTIQKDAPTKVIKVATPLFEKDNYLWMGIGAAIIALGMLLMSGGKNDSTTQFDYKLVYSFTRITLAPIVIILGLLVEIYAIFKKPKAVH